VPLLISATDDPDPAYRAAALEYAGRFINDRTVPRWIKQLNGAPDSAKAEILGMLGRAGHPAALPATLDALKSKNEHVRLAAVNAAGRIGGQEALPALLDLMRTGEPETINAVSRVVLTMKGPDVNRLVGNALSASSSPAAQVALIDILSARAADNRLYDVMPLLKSGDSLVSRSAFGALKHMVRPENLPLLFSRLSNSTDSSQISSLQDAIVSALSGVQNSNRRVSMVVAEMNKLPAKQSLYFPVLSGTGGAAAMQELLFRYNNGDEQTKRQVVAALSDCTDPAAANPLLLISRKSAGVDFSVQALAAYVRLASLSAFPGAERLLMLRNAMALAQDNGLKEQILHALPGCNTYPALMYAGQFLDDTLLQHTAAGSVVQLALSDEHWNGQTVRNLLEKASPLLTGPDATYEQQAVDKHLATLPAGEGFVSLFDGKDLKGWKGLVANPIERAKMDSQMLAGLQLIADARMRAGWSVQNGELVFSGKGDNLCTQKKYGDFELFVDWKINKGGDAGIYLRGSPQVQIWDTSRVDVGAQVGSGGLYNNVENPSKPLELADNAIGEWNNFHIIMKGDRVTVWLNGVLVVDNVILENYWDRNLPIFPEEQIELQAHGSQVFYRDLYIREFPRRQPDTLSEEEKQAGFKLLFDGTNMHDWVGNTAEYVMEDGDIVVHPEHGGHGNLYTRNEYSNFVFRFEFQLTPAANNGIGIRAPLEGDAAYVGMEIQVLDNEATVYKNLHPYQYHGSVYGVIPAKRGYLKPVGEWNTEEIRAEGTRIKVILNGTVILDGDIAEASRNGTMDGKEHPGLLRTSGHIGFLGHGDVVRFRRVRIKPLPDQP
jgi:HEAT repeat protein